MPPRKSGTNARTSSAKVSSRSGHSAWATAFPISRLRQKHAQDPSVLTTAPPGHCQDPSVLTTAYQGESPATQNCNLVAIHAAFAWCSWPHKTKRHVHCPFCPSARPRSVCETTVQKEGRQPFHGFLSTIMRHTVRKGKNLPSQGCVRINNRDWPAWRQGKKGP